MKHTIIFILTLFSLISLQAQFNKEMQKNISGKIYDLKKEHNGVFRQDSAIIRSLKILKQNKVNFKTIMKDSLRSILDYQGNHDYNVELISFSYSNEKDLLTVLNNYRNKNPENIIDDSLFNAIGYLVEENNESTQAYVIATQNYIEFNDFWAFYEFNDTKARTKGYQGRSKIEQVYYTTFYYKDDKKVELGSKEKIILDEDGYFEIVIDLNNEEDSLPEYFQIIDQNDKPLSQIKTRP